MLLGGLLFVAMAAASLAWRLGFFAHGPTVHSLEGYALERGYRFFGDAMSFEAVVGDVAVRVSLTFVPSHGGPTSAWRAEARAAVPIAGWVTARPRHEDASTAVRVGDLTFDSRFFVDASSRSVAKQVLSAELRRALEAFGPRGESRYDDGAFAFTWDDAGLDPPTLDAAIGIAVAACKLTKPAGIYRD